MAQAQHPATSTPAPKQVGSGYRNLDILAPGVTAIPVYDMTGTVVEEIVVSDDIPTDVIIALMRLSRLGGDGAETMGEADIAGIRGAVLALCQTNPTYAEWTERDVDRRWGLKQQVSILRSFFASLDLASLS